MRNELAPDEIELLTEICSPTGGCFAFDKSNLVILGKIGGEARGGRIKGRIVAPSAERMQFGADETLRLDSRLSVQTDDDALISVNFNVRLKGGRADSPRIGAPVKPKNAFLVSDVFMESADLRYEWLSRTWLIGKFIEAKIGASGFMKDEIYAVNRAGL